MAKGKWVVLFVLVIIAGIAAGVKLMGSTGSTAASQADSSPSPGPMRTSLSDEFMGITLQLHSGDAGDTYYRLIDEIAATKANTIALTVSAYQENCSSTSIFIDLRRVPDNDQLKGLIAYAHKKGLRVTLMPVVLLENPREGEWRGKINPTSWDDWWEDYSNYVLHYASLAQQADVELLMVGSELITTEAQTERWKKLIGQIRQAYKGRLSYSSNWDHYKVPQFWDSLDIIGMTTYYELTGGKKPTEPVLLESWQKIKKEILDWRAKSKLDRPLLFTEVGWPNQETAAEFPWDYYRAQDKPDPQLQALCFKTFFQTWADQKGVAGFLVWEWRTNLTQDTKPTSDTSYVPKGKPAMKYIEDFFSLGRRASTTQVASPARGQANAKPTEVPGEAKIAPTEAMIAPTEVPTALKDQP